MSRDISKAMKKDNCSVLRVGVWEGHMGALHLLQPQTGPASALPTLGS